MRYAKSLLFLSSLLVAGAGFFPLVRQEPEGEKAEILGVVEEFRRSIRDKDWSAFETLFLEADTPWIGTVAEAGRARYEAAGILDDDGLYRVTRAEFQERIDGRDAVSDEVFERIEIEVVDGFSTLLADYEFVSDGVVKNHGVESWTLVDTFSGWKIVSVLYSMTPGARPKPGGE